MKSTLVVIILSAVLVGCHSGGGVSSSLVKPSAPSYVAMPTIATPTGPTHYSNTDSIIISGVCNTGYTVSLNGSDTQQTTCLNSTYSFTVTKLFDSFYPFMITQIDLNAVASSPAVLFWVRKKNISPPQVTVPATNPYQSAATSLTISGNCESGAVVTLGQDGFGSSSCVNAHFSINFPKFADGSFTIAVTQTDQAGNTASTLLVWIKQALLVSPAAPQLVVATSQVFNVSGGSGVFSGGFQSNLSGAAYDNATRTYTAGTLAGVTDILRFTDTLGNRVDIPITTVSEPADHFDIPANSGDLQNQTIGRRLNEPLQVRVLDRFGNPVPNFGVLFRFTGGDATSLSTQSQMTNAMGYVSIIARMGYSSLKNVLGIKPLSGVLPDAVGSGRPTTSLIAFAQSTNTGEMGADFATSSNPVSMQLADFNGDGRRDIAVLNSGEPSIGIFLGKGNGLFAKMVKVRPVCPNPNAFTVNDFNGDSRLDFAIACTGSNQIALIFALPDGTYATPVLINGDPGETLPVGIASRDLNADGRVDLIALSAGGSVMTVRFGDGMGGFGLPVLYNAGLNPSAVTIRDLDNDGDPDLAVLNSGDSTISIYKNNGAGVFGVPSVFGTGSAPSFMLAQDFDGDGFADLAVSNSGDNTVSVLLNDQSGAFDPGPTTSVGVTPIALATRDMNRDGKYDLVVINNSDSNMQVLTGGGDGSFLPEPPVMVRSNPQYTLTEDLNGDMYPDVLVLSNGDQKIQFFPGSAAGVPGSSRATGSSPSAAALADFDEDGHLDQIIANKGANNITLWRGDGRGLFNESTSFNTNVGPSYVVARDFNNDGHQDIAVAQQNVSSVRIFLGKGDGTFEAPLDYGTGLQPVFLLPVDLNGDGVVDLISVNSGQNSISYLRGIGDGTFNVRMDYAVGSQPMAAAAADLNGDLEPDIITVNQASGTVSVLLNNGAGTLQTEVEYPVGAGPNSIVVGHFNADNNLDVVTANELEGSVAVLNGLGNGSFAPANSFSAGTQPKALQTGDFNGDGKPDMAVSNVGFNTVTVLYGAGNGQFNLSQVFPTAISGDFMKTTDVNADGAADLLILDSTGSKFDVLLGL